MQMTEPSTMAGCPLPIEMDIRSTVWAITFSENDKHIVSGDDKGVRVWRLEDGKQVAPTMETGTVNCLALSQDGRWVAVGTFRGDIFVWDANTQDRVIESIRDKEGDDVNGVDFSPDSTRLIAALRKGAAIIWNIQTRNQVETLSHSPAVLAAKYSPRGDRIATASYDEVRVWDSNSNDGRYLAKIKVNIFPLYNTGLLWSGSHLFVVSGDTIKKLNPYTSTVSKWSVPDATRHSYIAVPKHGRFIAYTSKDIVALFDTSTHSQLGEIRFPQHIKSIAFSEDDRFIVIGGGDGTIGVESLSRIIDSFPLPRLEPGFNEPRIDIDILAFNSWKEGQLEAADAVLTTAIIAQDRTHQALAARALVRARLCRWDEALVDAEKAITIEPSIVAYIAKSIVHAGNKERHKAYSACDLAFARCRLSHVTFLLLIKAIIIFMTGEHVDAISRVGDLIATVRFNSVCHVVQAYMHLHYGISHMECRNYEDAMHSFERARAKSRPSHANEALVFISLISGWKFDDIDIRIQQGFCEALCAMGRTKDASESIVELLRVLEKGPKTCEDITKWVSDIIRRCLSTPESNGAVALMRETDMLSLPFNPPPLLGEWAKAALMHQSWKDALADTVDFVTPRSVIYRVICEHLEATGRIADASDCLLEMASELSNEVDGEQLKWITKFKHWCRAKLEGFGDNAMNTRQYDKATFQYSAALLLKPPDTRALLIKRSRAWASMGLWEDALDDANAIIMLDPSSPLGYERKHAALRGAGCHGAARVAFETMLSVDPSRHYVQPTQTEVTIRVAIENAIRESPSVLINTESGRLLDKRSQASSFESQPIFHELVASMTTDIDCTRIEDEVGQYYRYAMFSHKWKDGEPGYDQVVQIVVYDLEEVPTHVKLQTFCKIARDAGLHWAWSDTCCINKSDPSVLQEALVSMFQWYQSSSLTVVSLCDVPFKRLGDSIWNSRAWTLQEYHASKVVRFYNKDWTLYRDLDVPNHKEAPEIIAEMEEATGVSAQALMALQPGLEDIREKLRLASSRQTTRTEDAAYSLLGIFSLTLSAVYGEGDKAVGRLLAQLLTSSGDTSILAWTGTSGGFNSCLPAKIAVFSQLQTTHIPPPIPTDELEIITAGLRSLSPASVMRLYDRLKELRIPFFNGKRMSLPCIMFKLGPLSVSRSGSEQVFRAQTDALGVVVIRTEENLSRFKSLCLVHPWIDYLLDRQPVGSATSAFETIPEEISIDQSSVSDPPSIPDSNNNIPGLQQVRRGLASFKLSLSRRSVTRARDAASLLAPSTVARKDKQREALQVLARLGERFGALLLTPDPKNVAAFRRVASGTLITVQVEEIKPRILDKLIDSVYTLDVL